jgi:hypothetical protein
MRTISRPTQAGQVRGARDCKPSRGPFSPVAVGSRPSQRWQAGRLPHGAFEVSFGDFVSRGHFQIFSKGLRYDSHAKGFHAD